MLALKNYTVSDSEPILDGFLFGFFRFQRVSSLFTLVTILTGAGLIGNSMSYDFKGERIRAKGERIYVYLLTLFCHF